MEFHVDVKWILVKISTQSLCYELGFSINLIGPLKHLKIIYLRFYKYLCSIFNDLINIFKGVFTFLCNDPKLDLWGKDQRKSILSLG